MTDTPPTEDPRPEGLERAVSLLLVNTGDGKGKSSAAFGVMLRAVAMGWPVVVVQFVKSGEWKVGEEKVGRQLGVEWHALGDGFTLGLRRTSTTTRPSPNARGRRLPAIIAAGEHRLVILDELTYLCTWGWIDTAEVVGSVARPARRRQRHRHRARRPAEIIEIADTVTEMRKVKHAYDKGIAAKKGIEY